MKTLSEGDLIEATLGDTVLRGRLNRFEQMPGVGRTPASLDLDGYRVRLIEKAVPALPTEPGFYLDDLGYCWSLEREGNWRWGGETYDTVPAHHLPIQKLEPVADTAKKVLERVELILSAGGIHALPNAFGGLAKEFGIQS